MDSATLAAWSSQVIRQRIGIGAIVLDCANRGIPQQRAEELAEDAVQEALRRATEATTTLTFETFAAFRAWIKRVALNYNRDVLRRMSRQRQFANGEDFDSPAPNAMLELLRELLPTLTEDERKLIDLSYLGQKQTLADLASCLLPEDSSNVSARVQRVWRRRRELLRKLAAALDLEPEPRGG
jgi:DNA-directed RNA polymerase specialized sigma24 family protein